jgi:high affinity Mn2+ porin
MLALPGWAADAVMPTKAAPSSAADSYNWNGFYAGGHLGYGWGRSYWASPETAGSIHLAQGIDSFAETGSFFGGLHFGYDYMLSNRVVLGLVADASFPSWPNLSGISIGGWTSYFSPAIGDQVTYSENVNLFGSVRARVGYAPSNWLVYATGGLAWTYNQLTLSQDTNGTTDTALLWRFGWTAGAGIEVPIAPHWTATIEYLFTRYGNSAVYFPAAGQRFVSDFSLQQLRAGLSYRFGDDGKPAKQPMAVKAPDPDLIKLHGQATFVWQGYPSIRSPYAGTNSLPGSGQGRQTFDATLYAGVRLWQGAEFWANLEIDQGFGVGNTHGVAGYLTGEAYKLGSAYPYTRVQRYLIRQTIDLGGPPEKIEAHYNHNEFGGTHTANRIVLTAGKFSVADIFDTNKYANNPRNDFLNWSLINAGTLDYAGDAWGISYGVTAEWYQGAWTLRAGIFDLSVMPAGGDSPDAFRLDPTFQQYQLLGELEHRHELWGQPGSLKLTGFVSRGRAGHFANAVALAQLTGQPADINAVRAYTSRPGLSLNLEQQVSEAVGIFARAGWADGKVEPWDFTDIDRTLAGGVSIAGKSWGRPDDRIGIGGVVNDIAPIHRAFLNAGGLGILVGDGRLPNPGREKLIEAYYSIAFGATTRLTFDYQFVANPAYNTDRGPVNAFAVRVHSHF